MAVGFTTITVYPSTDVATNDTVDFTYASGNASQFEQSNEVLVASGLNDVLDQAADTFTLSYSSTKVTLTYKGDTTIPAGSKLMLQLPKSGYGQLTDLTDNSGGTASTTLAAISGTYSQTEVRNSIASLAAAIANLNDRVNTLLTLSANKDHVPSYDRN